MLVEPTVHMLREMRLTAMADAYLEQQQDPKIRSVSRRSPSGSPVTSPDRVGFASASAEL
jgi:hypothetical protein